MTPLAGVKVLDLSRVFAGPVLTLWRPTYMNESQPEAAREAALAA